MFLGSWQGSSFKRKNVFNRYNIRNLLNDSFRGNVVLFIVSNLKLATSICFTNCFFYRSCNIICINQDFAPYVSGGAAYCLNERRLASEKSFFIGIQNCNERDFWQVQSLTQEIYTDQYIKIPTPQGGQNFDSLKRFNIAMKVCNFKFLLMHVFT